MTAKVVTVIGARPQFVKAAIVSHSLRSIVGLTEILVHTGQHYDQNMSSVFFDEMRMAKPDYNLMVGSGTHGAQTGAMLVKIEEVLFKERPNMVLVYGDTNSTLAGALAASKLHIPVAHVEAGLRSGNRRMPEEINRVLTDHLSDMLFAPTVTAVDNLRKEGISDTRIYMVGDVMYDAAVYYGRRGEEVSTVLARHGLQSGKYVLATIHRAENTDDPHRLRSIFEGLSRVATKLPVLIPLHPRTRASIRANGIAIDDRNELRIVDPVGYLDMVTLEKNAAVIATDSGGVQKEAFFYRVPCITLRSETEWVELVELGWNKLVDPSNADVIEREILEAVGKTGEHSSPYGDGTAAIQISKLVAYHCGM